MALFPTVAMALAAAVPAAPAAERADALADRGLAFLAGQQQADGSWQPAEQVPPAITALALRAFVGDDDFDADSPLVARGYDALLAQQVADGGIYDDLLANYNTAISVSALTAVGDDRYADRTAKAVAYLRRLQWTPETRPDFAGDEVVQEVRGEEDPFYGGFGYGGRSRGPGRPDLSNTAMALEALHDAGVGADDPAMRRALAFVNGLQNHSETNDAAWAGDDGGFVYSPDADRDGESFAGEYLTPVGERRLRSYGSMTYAGLKSMVYAGLTRDDPRVTAAFGWVQDNWTLDANPGMAAADPENADHGLYYYYLTLARALDAYDRPVLDTPAGPVDWRLALVEKLGELQRADGSWSGEAKWREEDPVLVTSYVVNALNATRKDLAEHPPEE